MLARLDLDELVRHELSRARDAAALAKLAQVSSWDPAREAENVAQVSSWDPAREAENVSLNAAPHHMSKSVRELSLREAWRRRREDAVLELLACDEGDWLAASGASARERELSAHVRSEAGATYRACDAPTLKELSPFLCLASWSGERGEARLGQLVALSRAHHAQLLAHAEFRAGLSAAATQPPGCEARPGRVVRVSAQRRMAQLRRLAAAQRVQRAVRGLLARRRAARLSAARRVQRWLRRVAARCAARRRARARAALRALLRRWRRRRLRRRSSGGAGALAAALAGSPRATALVVRAQACARRLAARRAAAYLRWEAASRGAAALQRAWRASRAAWARGEARALLRSTAPARLAVEKQLVELSLLKAVETQRLQAQYALYERRLAEQVQRAKLPPGWIEQPRGEGEREDAEPAPRYLCLETGKVHSQHPCAARAAEVRLAQRARASALLEHQLARLDAAARAVVAEESVALLQCAASLLGLEPPPAPAPVV
jgi:hypothetical protein